jgi:hypothetical protein
MFVSLRQFLGMLQIAVCAAVFCFAPFPPARGKKARREGDEARIVGSRASGS